MMCICTIALCAGCGGQPPVKEPRPPAPIVTPAIVTSPLAEPGAWSFEASDPAWTGDMIPTCAPVLADRLKSPSGGPIVPLGGDYWRTPIDVNADGSCRIDTTVTGGTHLASPEFSIRHPYISVLVGGAHADDAFVALEVEGRRVHTEHADGNVAMREAVWNVRDLMGKTARVVIADGGKHGILVDRVRSLDAEPVPKRAPVWGFADFHAHPMSFHGFGHHVLVGGVDGPIETALAPCTIEHGADGLGGNSGPAMGLLEPAYDHEVKLFHIGFVGHGNKGSGTFNDWPRCSSVAHQQMYVEWIRRAWKGGLRLMVANAVNNELLAHSFKGTGAVTDMDSAVEQLSALGDFVKGHSDFMAIAKTSKEARDIIESGRLAIVPGVEIDAIGECKREHDCTDKQVQDAIEALYKAGARHIFPVHLADNAFGGSSVYGAMFSLLSWYLTDHTQEVEADASVAYRLTRATNEREAKLYEALGVFKALRNQYDHPFKPNWQKYESIKPGHANVLGLTPQGEVALTSMREHGIVIDADHAGQKTRAGMYAYAKKEGIPLAFGHSWYRELAYTDDETSEPAKLKNEGTKTAEELETMYGLGGAVAVMANQGDVRSVPAAGVVNDCPGSSKSWLQAYVYAAAHMHGRGVGIGTDFDGLAGQPFPRFGTLACSGILLDAQSHGSFADKKRAAPRTPEQALRSSVDSQSGGVTYDGPIVDAEPHRFLHAPVRAYSHDETDVWRGIALHSAGTPPTGLGIAMDVARGLSDAGDDCNRPWCRAARAVKAGNLPSDAPANVRKDFEVIQPIWQRWQAMTTGNSGVPLVRDRLPGSRDFDVNLDGLAHYGLLPDFFQDVANQLKSGSGEVKDLSALFRSAEAYLEMWERAEAKVRR